MSDTYNIRANSLPFGMIFLYVHQAISIIHNCGGNLQIVSLQRGEILLLSDV